MIGDTLNKGTFVNSRCRFGFQRWCQCCAPLNSSLSKQALFCQWQLTDDEANSTQNALVSSKTIDINAGVNLDTVMADPSRVELLPKLVGLGSVEFVDSHCHLEEVLQLFRRYTVAPSLNKVLNLLSLEEKRHWRTLGWLDSDSDCLEEAGVDNVQDETYRNSNMFYNQVASQSEGSDPGKSIWMYVWYDMTSVQQEAAASLGWDANSWNSNQWPLPKDISWSNLTAEMQQHLEILGENARSWDNRHSQGESTTTKKKKKKKKNKVIVNEQRPWWQLALDEKQAAAALGFTQDTWNATELADVNEVIGRYFRPEFVACVTQGCSEDSIPYAQKLALAHDKVYVSFGCHPKAAWQYNDRLEEKLLTAAKACGKKTVAWGEFGLDYAHDYYGKLAQNRRAQKEVFARQLELAINNNFPLVLHVREAEHDTLRMLHSWVPRDWRIHLHSLRTSIMFLDTVLKGWTNAFVGFSGLIAMADAQVERMCQHCPLDRILIETDGPYLQLTGTNFSHPGHVPHIAVKIAKIKGCDPCEVLRASRANAFLMYGI